jgi:hypothetical protein
LEELECLIYVDFDADRKDLIDQLAVWSSVVPENIGITTDTLEIDVLTNNDDHFDETRDNLDDIYLTYSFILDIGPTAEDVSKENVVNSLARLLERFWAGGYPAVAECEFQELLPYGGKGMRHQLESRN